jgi:hypothetical protein
MELRAERQFEPAPRSSSGTTNPDTRSFSAVEKSHSELHGALAATHPDVQDQPGIHPLQKNVVLRSYLIRDAFRSISARYIYIWDNQSRDTRSISTTSE